MKEKEGKLPPPNRTERQVTSIFCLIFFKLIRVNASLGRNLASG
jgi:hypothetical protein